jgi:hypothetical protein
MEIPGNQQSRTSGVAQTSVTAHLNRTPELGEGKYLRFPFKPMFEA